MLNKLVQIVIMPCEIELAVRKEVRHNTNTHLNKNKLCGCDVTADLDFISKVWIHLNILHLSKLFLINRHCVSDLV